MRGVSSACGGVLVTPVERSPWMTLGIPQPLKPGPCRVSALSILKLGDVCVDIEICSLGPPIHPLLSQFSQG